MEKYYFRVSDYLHIACTGKHSVKLLIREKGNEVGEIFVRDGILWNAVDSDGEGEQAFLRMIFMKGVEVESFQLNEEAGFRKIQQNWEEILIKGAADKDKFRWQISEEIKSKSKSDEKVTDVIDRGLECLMRRDYKSAIKIFSDLNKRYPGNILIQSKLNKLQELGYDNSTTISK